ncbi:MAG TPA: 3-phosphoglycerate dehydrogenase, partial [Dielma fastidiosa]|nr:3-phosphoglycerate dehydrogenase [Dielma fastidiosa]
MKIKTYNKISKKGLNLFPVNYEVGDALEAADAILVRSATLHDIPFDPELKGI